MKFQRQAKILELIDRFEIETQEDLTDHLRAVGYNTTQATVSRDIKELRLIKSLSATTGKYKYTSAAAGAADSFTTRLRNIFRECVTDIDAAQNMIVTPMSRPTGRNGRRYQSEHQHHADPAGMLYLPGKIQRLHRARP